ncbi:hypothetical protein NQ176_g6904 [Zarea fungicola]|uniref:Uncharacterized protein n=1 Tax=Zarea fungicola TaxID=93591 RepID=A0ACC1N369_9HYPO|nr:hypothetical protein NQ176_g6904 [Lecanicillium fungicola]
MYISKILPTIVLAQAAAAGVCLLNCPSVNLSIWDQSNLPVCTGDPDFTNEFVSTGIDEVDGDCTALGTQPFSGAQIVSTSNLPSGTTCRLSFYADTACTQQLNSDSTLGSLRPDFHPTGCFGFSGVTSAARAAILNCNGQ